MTGLSIFVWWWYQYLNPEEEGEISIEGLDRELG